MATSAPAPVLVLVVDKGPKSGEVVECHPGRPTRIGRVVKGNTLAIKDPGISQKHLLLEFLPSLSRWAVSDLATSNGTLVNDVPIPPSAPQPLSHADTIKIGETTSISVQISTPEPPQEPPPPPRPRRGRAAAAAVVSDPAPEATVESAAAGKKRGRGRAKKAVVEKVVELTKDEFLEAVGVGDEVADPVAEEEAPGARNTRRGRGRGRGRGPTTATRVTRLRANSSVPLEVEKPTDPVAATDTEDPRAVEEPSDQVPDVVIEDPRAVEEPSDPTPAPATEVLREAEEPSNPVRRVTRSRANSSVPLEVEEPTDPVAATDMEDPRAAEEPSDQVPDVVIEDPRAIEEPSDPTPAPATEVLREAEEPSNPVPAAARGATRAAEEVSPGTCDGDEVGGFGEGESGAEEMGDDWVNMTLGQWFDRMEILLPRAINNVADEIIADLKNKARRFDEYTTECSNDLIV